MKKIKKISLAALSLLLCIWYSNSFATSSVQQIINNAKTSINDQFSWKWIKTDMMVWEQTNQLIAWKNTVDLSLWADKNNVNFSDNFIKVIERYIFWLLWIIAVTVFIYISYMLFTAEWKEDELKKAMKALTYAIVWLAIIPLSYIAIRIITWFNF